jgi:hypothetical protein
MINASPPTTTTAIIPTTRARLIADGTVGLRVYDSGEWSVTCRECDPPSGASLPDGLMPEMDDTWWCEWVAVAAWEMHVARHTALPAGLDGCPAVPAEI